MEKLIIEKKRAGMLFSISVIGAYLLMNILYAILPKWLISEFFAYLVQPLFFIGGAVYFANKQGNGVTNTLKIKKFNPKYLLYAAGLFFGLFFGFGYLNTLFTEFLSSNGVSVGEVNISLTNFGEYVLYLTSLSLAPAVGEELLFRTLALFVLTAGTGIENEKDANGYGIKNDILICLIIGCLFAVYHKNIAQLIYQFISGFVLTLIVIRSGSVIPAIVMHLLNNALILTVTFIDPTVNILTLPLMIAGLIVFAVAFPLLILDGRQNKVQRVDYISGLPYLCLAFGFCVIMLVLGNFA